MYCLSKDKLRVTEAIGFGITELEAPVRYMKNNELVTSIPGQKMYCIFTNNGYLMDALESEAEAKERIKDVMQALAAGIEGFEF